MDADERRVGEYKVLSGEFKTAGAQKGKRALTNQEVRQYRAQYARGEISNRQIRAITGLGGETVARMLRGETYANVMDAQAPDEVSADEMLASMERLMEVQRKVDEEGVVDGRAKLIEKIPGIDRPSVQERLQGIVGKRLLPQGEEEAKGALGDLTAAPEEMPPNPLEEA
jgi:hypothetical protein